MKKTIILSLAAMAGAYCTPASAQTLKTQADSTSYVAGYAVTSGLSSFLKQSFDVDESQMEDVIRGFKDGYAKRNDKAHRAFVAGQQVAIMLDKQMLPRMTADFEGSDNALSEDLIVQGFEASLRGDTTICTPKQAEEKFNAARKEAKAQKELANKAKGEKFLAENKKKKDVVTLPDGLQYKVLTKGNGPIPTASDKVQVVYEGRTLDGKVFDATKNHGKEYDEFNADRLIKGWTEALTMMPVGSKWEIYIPQELAYGARGAGRDIEPYSALIFTLELKGIVPKKSEAEATTPTATTKAQQAKTATKKPAGKAVAKKATKK